MSFQCCTQAEGRTIDSCLVQPNIVGPTRSVLGSVAALHCVSELHYPHLIPSVYSQTLTSIMKNEFL